MKIKKYIVRDMHEALKLIREELGPDAVIISNYRLPRKKLMDFFSPRMMEVTAALDEPKKTVQTGTPRLTGGGEQSARKLLHMLREFDSGGFRREPFQFDRGSMAYFYQDGDRQPEVPFDMVLKNEGNSLVHIEINQQWKKILTKLEINDSIIQNLLRSLREAVGSQEDSYEMPEMLEAYLVILKNKIAKLLEPAYRPVPTQRICTFVGPSGTGKTLSLAKLATHYKLHDQKKVAIVSASLNGHRPGQLEALKYYGSLIDTPVKNAGSRGELIDIIDSFADMDVIFIDTVGTSPRNAGAMLKLNNLLQPFEGKQDIYLVMSTTTKGNDLLKTAIEYQKIGYSKLIFTKLDETDTCGSILNVVCRIGVPVAYVSYGQNVPDDIAAVNPKKLAGLLLGGVDRYVEQSLQIR